MKRKKTFTLLAVFVITVLTIGSMVGCSSKDFDEQDFSIAITSLKVDGNKVAVEVEFKNNSWHNGWVVSNGVSKKPYTIIKVIYTDEKGEPEWNFVSIGINNWIRCKQKIKRTVEFELEKGKYKITAIVDFHIESKNKSFYYSVEDEIEVK